MGVIDVEKPDFIYSLHNAGFGGVYFYINREALELYPRFLGLLKGKNFH